MKQMNNAIKNSQGQLPLILIPAYRNGHFNREDFSIKVRFEIQNGGEHLWANNVTLENGKYYGIIDEACRQNR